LASIKTKALELTLYQNYPNPFKPSTVISFTLPERAHATLSIYTSDGKLVTTLVGGMLDEGLKDVAWDRKDAKGNPVSSGV